MTFLPIKSVQVKVQAVCSLVKECFDQGSKVLITVPNDAAADYVDQMLWKYPRESFLPHARSGENEAVLISHTHENLNGAETLLNLCPEVSPIVTQFKYVFELYDQTQAQKQALSQQRYKFYQGQPSQFTILAQSS